MVRWMVRWADDIGGGEDVGWLGIFLMRAAVSSSWYHSCSGDLAPSVKHEYSCNQAGGEVVMWVD